VSALCLLSLVKHRHSVFWDGKTVLNLTTDSSNFTNRNVSWEDDDYSDV
jgi:hypothetical protein